MIERAKRRAPMRLAVTSLLVAAGVGVVGVVPAMAAGDSPAAAASPSDRDQHWRGHHGRWFRDRGDVRYVWFRVCDTDPTTATAPVAPATTTTETPVAGATTDTVAPDAITAAVEGAAADTATTTDDATATDIVTGETTTTETTTETTTTGTTTTGTTTTEAAPVDEDTPDAKEYPTFIVVPMAKDEARAIRKLDERPCYDLTTRAPATTDTTTTTTTDAVVDPGTTVETTTTTPVDTTVTG